MQISAEDAISVLRKWKEERRILQCIFADSRDEDTASSCACLGRIEELDDDSVRIDARRMQIPGARGDLIGCFIRFHGAEFGLFDWRNVAPEDAVGQHAMRQSYEMVLIVLLPTGCNCELRAAKLSREILDEAGAKT